MLEWRDLDYKLEFGLENLTAEAMHAMRVRLQNDPMLQYNLMVKKIGLDPADPEEQAWAVELLSKKGLIDEKTGSTFAQICLMSRSLSTAEFVACLAKDPNRPRPQKKALSDTQHPLQHIE